jgi:cytochrome P450/NADPH-cytochrome P450 reductase
VQDRIWDQRDAVWNLLKANAVIYVCGDGLHMAPDVRATCLRIYAEKTKTSPDASEAWLRKLEETQRYLVDVFGQKKL